MDDDDAGELRSVGVSALGLLALARLAAVIRVFVVTLILLPLRGESDAAYRWRLAIAIVDRDQDPREQDLLASLAWSESTFLETMARCVVTGDRGRSLGAFQVQPRSDTERTLLCGELEDQVDIAVARIHESFAACRALPENERLAAYCSGSCSRGRRASRVRMRRIEWGPTQ